MVRMTAGVDGEKIEKILQDWNIMCRCGLNEDSATYQAYIAER